MSAPSHGSITKISVFFLSKSFQDFYDKSPLQIIFSFNEWEKQTTICIKSFLSECDEQVLNNITQNILALNNAIHWLSKCPFNELPQELIKETVTFVKLVYHDADIYYSKKPKKPLEDIRDIKSSVTIDDTRLLPSRFCFIETLVEQITKKSNISFEVKKEYYKSSLR